MLTFTFVQDVHEDGVRLRARLAAAPHEEDAAVPRAQVHPLPGLLLLERGKAQCGRGKDLVQCLVLSPAGRWVVTVKGLSIHSEDIF